MKNKYVTIQHDLTYNLYELSYCMVTSMEIDINAKINVYNVSNLMRKMKNMNKGASNHCIINRQNVEYYNLF